MPHYSLAREKAPKKKKRNKIGKMRKGESLNEY